MIKPVIGMNVWYYPGGADQMESGEQPRFATIAHVYGARCVNIGFLNMNGDHRNATSVPLLQDDDAPSGLGFCTWAPIKVEAELDIALKAPATPPDQSQHASKVLYPAIKAAMDELGRIEPGMHATMDCAFNHLHAAFWSETPAPSSVPQLRPVWWR